MARSAIRTFLLLASATFAAAEQTYVTRFDAFAGYTYFNSPIVSLVEHGFHLQAGVRPWTWLSLGFDYSNVSGDLSLGPDFLQPAVQAQLGGLLARFAAAGQLPAGYVLSVPVGSKTQTFAAGPQLAYRRWSSVTLFVRPSCGLIREVAVPRPTDAISTAVVAALAPSGEKRDWTTFYGFGGGFDINISRHLAIRTQADFVRDHLFKDILRDSRNTVRFSIGPAFNFGRNIARGN